jgi:hypothetical protein
LEESRQSERQGDKKPRPSLLTSIQTVADFLATRALGLRYQEIIFPHLLYGNDQLEKYAPAKFVRIKEQFAEWKQQHPEAVNSVEFNKILPNSTLDEQLDVAARMPAQYREQLYNQIAWNAAGKGDYERARQIITQNISPEQRSQRLAELSRQAAWEAASKGDFNAARALALEGVGARDERAAFLAQLVTSAGEKLSKTEAVEILELASGLLRSPLETFGELNASLQIAGAFAGVDSRRAGQMLESAADRINEIVNGLAPIDGFFPSRSFEDGELLLESGFVSNSLVAPYANAAASLARYDPENARSLAAKLQRPEARAQVYLEISRALASSVRSRDTGVFLGSGVVGSGFVVRR